RPPPTSTPFPYTTLFRSHRLQPVRADRVHAPAIGRRRPRTAGAEHQRLARPVDVGVEDAGLRAFGLQRERKIHRHGRLAHAALRSEEDTSELQSLAYLVC